MGIVINNNVTALNAWRNLSISNNNLSRSLEKLSSGYKINRGGDNPAGLVISEQLRAQATGLEQAIQNTEDAISVIQVAEGALSEVHNILNSIRALAIHAANEGANDADSLAADQSQVDNAIEAISRIANTTKFLGKFLLNGGAGNTATIIDSDQVDSVTVLTAQTTGYLAYTVTTAAAKAVHTAIGETMWSGGGAIAHNDTITLNGVGIAVTSGFTAASVVSAVNARSADTGVSAATSGNNIVFTQSNYGSDYKIDISAGQSGSLGVSTTVNSTAGITAGSDVEGTVGGIAAQGSGLILTAGTGDWKGTAVTLKEAGNTTGATGTASSKDISVTKSQLKFSIGGNATAQEVITFSINDMRATNLGSSGNGFLDNTTSGIKTGQNNALATNASGAVQIIDDAIRDVSDERSKLGAYQKNAIEAMQNNLGATLENIQASESRIRDLDMAKEMMSFTKNQILVQAGTAMLAQANQLPQNILSLIQ